MSMEQSMRRRSADSVSEEAVHLDSKDLRGLTDCQSFIEGRQCTLGECSFRHCDAARETKFFCDMWFSKRCTDMLCPKRHPEVITRQSDHQSKVRNALCSSHNAFKCTGECGFDECNTHFLKQETLQEHINMGHEKKSLLSSSCFQCKAIFFSEQEGQQHFCVNATTEPYVNPSTSFSPSGQGLLSYTALAFKNPQPGTPSQAPTAEPIGVFWDIENCQVPHNKSAFDVVQKIKNDYFTGKHEVEFICVCDASKEKKEIIDELNKAQVNVVHISATSKNAADDKLKQSLQRFAEIFLSPATVILVSGDINFAPELSDLRYRHNLTVICLHNAQAQDALLKCAHEARRFDQFTTDLPDRKCNALFFSEQEREEHVCLSAITEPSSSCQANIPPQNLIKPQYLYVNPSTSLSPSGQGLLNNTDSLAFKNPQPGTPSQAPTVEPIGVFWDIENCQVPRNKSAFDVVQKIKNDYFTGKREVEFICVCDTSKEKKEIIDELNKAQVNVVHISAHSKNAADDKLKQSLQRFAGIFLSPATVILVSGDINFAPELSDLRYRRNLTVICLHNAQAQDALLKCAHEARRFDHLTADLPDRKACEKNGLSSELHVLNLPMNIDHARVKNKLEKLSTNCGGKVESISGCTSVLRFPDPTSASRARRRMDKENVFGSKIQVVYPTSNHNTQPTKAACDSVKGRETCMSPKSTPSSPQKGKKDSSCVLLNTSDIKSTIPSRHTTKKESNPSLTPTDESPKSGDVSYKTEPMEAAGDSIKGRKTCMSPKSTPSTLQKGKKDSSCALRDTFGKESKIPSRHTTKKEGNPSQTHQDKSPDSEDSREENVANDDLAASGLASLQNCTVLDKQEEGFDLLVTNLDENVSKKELEKELASVFQEYWSRVNMATKKRKQLWHLMLEVISILGEVPLYFLPLDKFLSDYHEKFSRMFEMNSLINLQDLVVLTGKPGNQAISLVTKAIGGVRVSVDPDQFANDVHTLLKSCGGSLPLVRFAASYLLKFDRKIESNVQGSALKEVLRFVPNVKVTESSTVSWAQQTLEHGGNVSKLLEFTKDLRELLQNQKEFKLPLSLLNSQYQVWFEKKTQFNPAVYGFASVITLLKALPAVVEVTQQGKETWIILSQRLKTKAFAYNVRMLLETQADGVIAVGKFVSSYSKYFSQDCKMATFGFSKLHDLIEAVPNVAKIQGTGNEQLICLVGQDKSSKPEKRSDKETLVKELEELLSGFDSQRFPVARVRTRYWIHFDRPLKFEDYGAQHLEDFLESSPSLQIIEISGNKYLTYSPKVTVQSLQGHLVELLKRQDGKFLPISDVVSRLRKQRDMKFLLEEDQLKELLPRLEAVEVRGSGNGRILLLPPLPAEDNMSPELQPLANEVTNLLLKFPGCRVAESSFADNFRQEYGKMLKPEDWGFTTMASLVQALGDVLEVQDSGNDAKVCLRYEQYLKEFSRHVIHVLTEKSDKTIPLSQFVTAYEKLCNHKLRVQNFGFASLEDMFRAISPVVKVDTKGDKLSLTLLQTFAIETRDLLKHLNGCVSLNHFPQNFNQFYGRTCKTSDYGFRGISELIDAVSNVAEIRGSGKKKMVILVDGDNASLLGSGNMRIPNGEASGTILGHTVTDNWQMASAFKTFPDSELTSPISEPKRIGKLMSCFPL